MRTFTVVALDETMDWNHPALVKQAGGTLYTIYAFDPMEVTHLAESTPNYRLVPFEVVPKVYPDDEKEWELMYDELQHGLNEGCEIAYFTCNHIDGLSDKFKHSEDFDNTETLDDALEHFRGNGTVPEALR